jgi:hypothetical protein
MCGIVGFTGKQQAAPVLLAGLSKLEYRGYDSAGLAVRDGENPAEVVKATGKLKNLGKDVGGAIKGFKEGLNEGDAPAAKAETPKVEVAKTAETVEGKAKEKTEA